MNSATIVQKLWNYCNILRDDGLSYGDYVERLTFLLFWLRNGSLSESDNLPPPDVIALEIMEDLEAALAQIRDRG